METEDTLLTEPCKPVPVEMAISIRDFKTHLARVLSCIDMKKQDFCSYVCLSETDMVGTNGSVLYKGTLPFSVPEKMTVRAADLLPILKWGTKREDHFRLEMEITESAGKKSILFSFCGQTLSVPVWTTRYPAYREMFKEGVFEPVTAVTAMKIDASLVARILKTCEDVRLTMGKADNENIFMFAETLDAVKGNFVIGGLQD